MYRQCSEDEHPPGNDIHGSMFQRPAKGRKLVLGS